MRRKSDGWLNATQILKVAGFDKPQRTRVLEREVQKGTHEKVQGGYGKYQGEPSISSMGFEAAGTAAAVELATPNRRGAESLREARTGSGWAQRVKQVCKASTLCKSPLPSLGLDRSTSFTRRVAFDRGGRRVRGEEAAPLERDAHR